jgi:branched-chain amino acid transport system substrate-binding protein
MTQLIQTNRTMKFSMMALALACSGSVFAQAKEQLVKIGHAAPLTGGQGHWGKDNENGARLAIEELNAKGLVIGGRKIKFELLSEDDQADPKQGVIVANKLVDAGVKGVLGHFNSGTTIPASKIYNEAGIVHITSSATNLTLTQAGYKTTFRNIANDGSVGGAIAKYALKDLKATKVAVVDDRTAYGQGVAQVFNKVAKSDGATIVSEQYANDKTVDFMAILTAIKGKNPDVVFYGGMDAQAGVLARQMKQLGMSAKLLGADGICSKEIANLSHNAVNDVLYCTNGGTELMKMPKGPEFAQRFKKRFGNDVLVYAPYAYDAMMTFAAAMKNADSVEPAKYLPALAKIHYEGVTGVTEFDERGDLRNPGVTVFTFRNGEKVPVPM